MIGTLLSVVFPGLGQFYFGKTVRGSVMLLMGVTPLYPAALIWSVIDAHRLHERGAIPVYDRREALWGVLVAVVILPLGLGTTGFVALRGFSWFQDTYTFRSGTVTETQEIAAALEDFRHAHGRYPPDLKTLAGTRPLRKDWLADSWGQPYLYEIREDGEGYTLASRSGDGVAGTADDISVAVP